MCEQIRWKKAHPLVSEEIENHIWDQKEALIAKGYDEETATAEAIKEMGDPVVVGTAFDRTHKPKLEWSIMILFAVMTLVGLAIRLWMINDGVSPVTFGTEMVQVIVGVACMITAYMVDFTIAGKYSKLINILLIVAAIAILVYSPIVNGQYSYLTYMIMLFPTAFAAIIYHMRSRGFVGLIICLLFFAIPLYFSMQIPSVSSLTLFVVSGLLLMTLAIVKGWFSVNKWLALLLTYLPVVALILAIISDSRFGGRIQEVIDFFVNPNSNRHYYEMIIRENIASAKWWGTGASTAAEIYYMHTDHLLTYVIHQFGWFFFIGVMVMIIAFIVRAAILCAKQKSILGRLLSTAVLLTFTLQVAMYVAYNLGYLFYSPLSLPLISNGGIALTMNMILIGLMLSVFKSGHMVKDSLPQRPANKLVEW